MRSVFFNFGTGLCLLVSSLTSPLSAAVELVPSRLSYDAHIVKGVSLNGTAIREVRKQADGRWIYDFNVKSFIADIREYSIVDWNGQNLIPHRYHYEMTGFFVPDKDINVYFDWNKSEARNPARKKGWTLPVEPGAQDRLSYQLQIRMDLIQGKSVMVYKVPHKAKIREYTFRIEGEEYLETKNLGKIATTIVKKVRDKNAKRQTTLWFARDYDFVLVKMLQLEKDGQRYEINLKGGTVGNKTIGTIKP